MKNIGTKIIEQVLLFDDHKNSDKPIAISTTTVIGSNWKAQRSMLKDIPKKDGSTIDPMMRRSACLGTGYHMRAEQALRGDINTKAIEKFNERELDGVWISGTFDLLYCVDGKNHLNDHKTGYGKLFPETNIEKAILQQSIYRWLNQDDYAIDDTAYILFVSQSNNAYEGIEITLMSIEDTETYLKGRIKEIKAQGMIDCKNNVKYNPCNYCDYDEKDCKKLYENQAGGF